MRVLHVTACDLAHENGYRSRVFAELHELRRRGTSVRLLALLGLREVAGRSGRLRRAREELAGMGVSSLVIPTPPDLGLHGPHLAMRRYRAAALGLAARWLRPDVLHVQGVEAGDAAVLSRRLHGRPLVLELHGVAETERAREEGYASTRARVLRRMRRSAIAGADAVIACSRAMADVMRGRRPPRRGQEWLVIPSCVDTDLFRWAPAARAAARERLGLGDRPVILYLGGWQSYQEGRLTIRAFRELQRRAPAAALLLVIPDNFHTEVRRELRGLDARDVRLLSLPFSEGPALLPAADVGLVLREDSIVNHVASPIKVGEYLASGVPVLGSATTGDLSTLLPALDVGDVTGSYDAGTVAAVLAALLERVCGDRAAWAERCAAAARAELAWSSYIDPLLDLYGRLAAPHGYADAPMRRPDRSPETAS